MSYNTAVEFRLISTWPLHVLLTNGSIIVVNVFSLIGKSITVTEKQTSSASDYVVCDDYFFFQICLFAGGLL